MHGPYSKDLLHTLRPFCKITNVSMRSGVTAQALQALGFLGLVS